MTDEPKVYQVNDILRGYNDLDKVVNVYRDVRALLPNEPIQESEEPYFIRGDGSGDVDGNYGWQLYKTPEGVVMLEFYGGWGGYAGDRSPAYNVEKRQLHQLTLTLHPPQPDLEKRIEKVLAKYPEAQRRKAVTPQ